MCAGHAALQCCGWRALRLLQGGLGVAAEEGGGRPLHWMAQQRAGPPRTAPPSRLPRLQQLTHEADGLIFQGAQVRLS